LTTFIVVLIVNEGTVVILRIEDCQIWKMNDFKCVNVLIGVHANFDTCDLKQY